MSNLFGSEAWLAAVSGVVSPVFALRIGLRAHQLELVITETMELSLGSTIDALRDSTGTLGLVVHWAFPIVLSIINGLF